MRTGFNEAFESVVSMLREKVADRLDVGLRHVKILYVDAYEIDDCYCYDNDPECGWHGFRDESYHYFEYQYRKSLDSMEYEEPVVMVWQHTQEEQGYNVHDDIMTEEEFKTLIEEKSKDECSMEFGCCSGFANNEEEISNKEPLNVQDIKYALTLDLDEDCEYVYAQRPGEDFTRVYKEFCTSTRKIGEDGRFV